MQRANSIGPLILKDSEVFMMLPQILLHTARPIRSWLLLLATACAAFSVLSGCGGSTGDDPPAPAPAPVPVPPLGPPVVLLNDIAIGTKYWPDSTNGSGNTDNGGLGQPVAGISCGKMVENYHVHSHLSIMLNGQPLQVPAQIGIVSRTALSNGCYYNLHTHDASGKIHAEDAAPRRFTLGQVFAIWGQPLSYSNIAGIRGLPVAVYLVDRGVTSVYTGDLAEIEIADHRGITIQIGAPVEKLPNYVWD
jgi:hypothetical protein